MLAVIAAFAPSAAEAGTYVIQSCAYSPTQSLTGWWSEETLGSSGATPYFYGTNDCTSAGLYRRFEVNTIPAGTYSAWTFEAPDNTWIDEATLYQSIVARSAGAYDSIVAELDDGGRRTIANYIAGDSVGDKTYSMPASGGHPIRLRTELGCQAGGANCSGMSGGSYGNVWRLTGSAIKVVDPSLPTLSSVSGGGWGTQPQDGLSQVDYTVSDLGSGVASVRFLVDGIETARNVEACRTGAAYVPCPLNSSGHFMFDTTRLSEGEHTIAVVAADHSGNVTIASEKQLTVTVRRPPAPPSSDPVAVTDPSANGGGSPAVGDVLAGDVGTWTGTGITYSYQWMRCSEYGMDCVPIPGATGLNYTATPADIGHALQLCVTGTNSGGSVTSCSMPTPAVIAVHPSTGGGTTANTADPADRPGEPTKQTSTSPAAAGADRGAPNGSPASDKVVLTALVNNRASSMKVKFGKRVPISGRLVGPGGTPIANAVLEVQTQTAMPGASVADAGKIVTNSDGRFTYVAPAGPSRVVRIAYRSHVGDTSFADTSDVTLLVKAGVTIKATPKKVRNRHATIFVGKLLGKPISKRGVIVDLQVFFRHKWRTFGAPRTNRAGKYRFKYRFMAGAATWKFRARVRRESSYPFIEGYSARTVKVKVTK